MLFIFCRYKNFWDIGIYLKPHFYENLKNFEILYNRFSLTSANKPKSYLALYQQVWSQLWPYNSPLKMLVKFVLKMLR